MNTLIKIKDSQITADDFDNQYLHLYPLPKRIGQRAICGKIRTRFARSPNKPKCPICLVLKRDGFAFAA